MAIPATDKISSTFGTPYIRDTFRNGDRFTASLRTIEDGLQAGKIWNQEFLAAKSWIADACEHAQHIAADEARRKRQPFNAATTVSYGDCRDDIGYAFQMNQAAKLSRNLKKLAKRIPDVLSPGIAEYILTLDQIDAVWKWLQSVKPIIVKGRKPAENPKPEDITNTGHCAICEVRFKLERHGERKMVHHGFRISDRMGHYYGHRSGKCFGTAYLPYELSNQANIEYKYFLEQELKDAESHLADLKASVPDTLLVQEYQKGIAFPVNVPYARGTKKYEDERQRRIWQTESEIRWLNEAIPYQQVRIDTWRLRTLAD
jgi:hypothetical protein